MTTHVGALTETGTIDGVNRYVWSENAGWIDFGDSTESVVVTGDGLTGAAWSENTGWIVLSCETTDSCDSVAFGVTNDGEGNLSGYGWGENTGWIDFDSAHDEVTIGTDGIFSGAAWSETIGWVFFNCAETDSCATVGYFVETDWRPQSARSNNVTGSGGFTGRNNDDTDIENENFSAPESSSSQLFFDDLVTVVRRAARAATGGVFGNPLDEGGNGTATATIRIPSPLHRVFRLPDVATIEDSAVLDLCNEYAAAVVCTECLKPIFGPCWLLLALILLLFFLIVRERRNRKRKRKQL